MSEHRKYYHTDIESGVTYEISKETHEAIHRIWEVIRLKLNKDGKRLGSVLIFGTGGSGKDLKGLESIFYNPEQYKDFKFTGHEEAGSFPKFIPAYKSKEDEK